MKILYLTSSLKSGGGITKYNLGFLEALRKRGVEIKVAELKESNLFFKGIFVISTFFQCSLFKPEFLILAHANFLPIAVAFKKIFGKDYAVETYGIDVWDIKSAAIKNGLRGARLIYSIANYTKNKMAEQIPEISEKIFILPNFIDGEKFKLGEKPDWLFKKYNIGASEKIILTLSRLWSSEGYKGYDRVLEALPGVLKEIPEARYIIAGDGDDAPRIKKMIIEMGLGEKVVITGFVSDEERLGLYNFCDVFAMPSKGEGFASVFLEALACGKPVLGGNADGTVDPLLNGELGVLVNPDSVADISQALIRILKKEISSNLVDPHVLRRRVLDTFGTDNFEKKVGESLDVLSAK